MINFKQIFCGHIWKQDSKEYLGAYEIYLLRGSLDSIREEYAVYSHCIKCDKENVHRVDIYRKPTQEEIDLRNIRY